MKTKIVRSETFKIALCSYFDSMRKKFSEWTLMHADIYWNMLQDKSNVLNLGSGYGFWKEEFNKRPSKRFNIESNDISSFRFDNFVGGQYA